MRKLLSSLLVAGLVVSTPLASLAADNTDLSVIGESAVTTEALTSNETTVTETKAATTFNDSYGTWKRSGSRWWFQFADGGYASDGAYEIDGSIYAFDKDGWMITGWGYIDEDWYYCNASGVAQLGWQYIGGKWYYFDPESAVMIHGYDYGTYYSVDDVVYFFLPSGALANGWFYKPEFGNEPGFWLYFNQGIECVGWQYIDGEWYYFEAFNSLGIQMCANGWYEIDGTEYYFLPSGAMADGWVYEDGKWYYFNASGIIQTGWQYIDGNWYRFDEETGYMYAGEWFEQYYFHSNGSMATGWTLIDDEWFYFEPSGNAHWGWIESNGDWYYCTLGYACEDMIFYDGNIRYALGTTGKMVKNNWFYYSSADEDEGWYYFDASGAGHNGWLSYGGKWYYCEDGFMVYNKTLEIDGKVAIFDESGVWIGYM